MFPWTEYFRSVGDVWIVWLVCAAALAWCLRRTIGRPSFRRVVAFAADERGMAYVLPYMLTFPIYLLVMCCMVQCTMILMVKMVSMQAASAAARAAVVWRSARPTSLTESYDLAVKHAYRAAVIAMTPVASSQSRHEMNFFLFNEPYSKNRNGAASVAAEILMHYLPAYFSIVDDNIRMAKRRGDRTNRYIRDPDDTYPTLSISQKALYAARATVVEFSSSPKHWNETLEVTVRYAMPMHIPGAGRIVGQHHGRGNFHTREILTTAFMPLESPKTSPRSLKPLLTIDYYPEDLR